MQLELDTDYVRGPGFEYLHRHWWISELLSLEYKQPVPPLTHAQ